jgi:hypothetical protein
LQDAASSTERATSSPGGQGRLLRSSLTRNSAACNN